MRVDKKCEKFVIVLFPDHTHLLFVVFAGGSLILCHF